MGKKSRKGVSRAGTNKHPGAGKGRAKTGRAKSDASSRASRDNISVDENPDLTRLASESKAPTGPPPKDVIAVVNNLVAAQQLNAEAAAVAMAPVVACAMSSGTSNKENNSAEPTMNSKNPPAPDAEDEIADIGDVDDTPLHVGVGAEEKPLNLEVKEAPEPLKVEETVPLVKAEDPEVVSPVVEPLTPEVSEPIEVDEPVLDVEPPTLNVDSAAEVVKAPKPAVPQPESMEESITAPEAKNVEEPAAPTVVMPKVEELVVAEPDSAKVAEVPVSNGSDVPSNPIPPTDDITEKETAPDVWSQKLRDVVVEEPTKPVLDVTPPPKTTSRSATPLDKPNAQEADVQQTDCGCVIL